MNPLQPTTSRIARFGLIFFLVVGVIALMMTVELLPKPDNTYFWRSVYDGGHAPLFGTMSLIFLWLCRLLPRLNRIKVSTQYLLAGTVAMLIGIAVEVSQINTGRDADVMDAVRNGVGIVAFLLVAATLDERLRKMADGKNIWNQFRWIIRFVALLIFSIPFIRAASWAVATIDRNIRFPLIADYESGLQVMPMMTRSGSARRIARPAEFQDGSGKYCQEVLLRPTRTNPYPTLQIEEPYPDWREYDSLRFRILLQDSTSRTLWIRINDRLHNSHPSDRFNRRLELHPGPQEIAISLEDIRLAPEKREMNLERMRSIRLFLTPHDTEIRFLLDDIRLK